MKLRTWTDGKHAVMWEAYKEETVAPIISDKAPIWDEVNQRYVVKPVPSVNEPATVTVPYKSPGERTRASITRNTIIAMLTSLLLGLGALIVKVQSGEFPDTQTIVFAVVALAIQVAFVGLQKYQSASGEES